MPKKLIICCDGTWNTQDQNEKSTPCPTNVELIARALRGEDANKIPQVVHYESGVGTDWGFSLRGGALGRGLWQNVVDCYRFLVHNYCAEDKLYIFGFSRGAFTARSLAGLIRNSGILKRGHEEFEKEALELYRDDDPETTPMSKRCRELRAQHCVEPDTTIDFLGVWDTVGALGIPGLDGSFHFLKQLNWQFHDVELSSWVKRARHALAIHEHRLEFEPSKWKRQAGDQADKDKLLQMWFSGAHSDVGGGYPERGLSDVSLEWMMEEATKAGLVFGRDALPTHKPDAYAKPHDSFSTVYRLLDFFRGHKGGEPRKWAPTAETCEDIHPAVIDRYKAKIPGDIWPPSFDAELKRRS